MSDTGTPNTAQFGDEMQIPDQNYSPACSADSSSVGQGDCNPTQDLTEHALITAGNVPTCPPQITHEPNNQAESIRKAKPQTVFPFQNKLKGLALQKFHHDNNKPVDPAPITFDLTEWYSFSQADENTDIFTETELERSLNSQFILKIKNSITFSPYRPQEGCFKAIIEMKNTSKFNMAYRVKSSSLKMFLINEPCAYVNPLSTKQVLVTTNPKYRYTFMDLGDANFVVGAYPVLYRCQLTPEKLDVLWRAFDSLLLPWTSAELHRIQWVRPETESMLDNYSLLERIQLIRPGPNRAEIEEAEQNPIDLYTFHRIWNDHGLEKEALLMDFVQKFRIRAYKRSAVVLRNDVEERKRLLLKVGAGALIALICYCFLGRLVRRDPLPLTVGFLDGSGKLNSGFQVPKSWYERFYDAVVDGMENLMNFGQDVFS